MGTPLAAKNARVQIEAVNINMASWNVSMNTQDIDVTSFEDGGFYVPLAGVRKAEVRVKGYWDSGDNPHDDPPDIQDGEALTNVRLYPDQNAGDYWDFPAMMVTGVTISAEVNGKVEIEFTAVSNGTFVYAGQ